jgi:NADH dehydrogenase [ubiquinone] 1 alpha subcomplex assembly factor 5
VLNLAESEREGGISPNVIPFKEMSELGNLLSRTGYNLTTLNMTKYSLQFKDFSQICDFLKAVGESNFLINRRRFKSRDTFLAASSIYNSLYNKKTYGGK